MKRRLFGGRILFQALSFVISIWAKLFVFLIFFFVLDGVCIFLLQDAVFPQMCLRPSNSTQATNNSLVDMVDCTTPTSPSVTTSSANPGLLLPHTHLFCPSGSCSAIFTRCRRCLASNFLRLCQTTSLLVFHYLPRLFLGNNNILGESNTLPLFISTY